MIAVEPVSSGMSAARSLLPSLLLGLIGCAGPAVVADYPHQQRIIGLSHSALLSCAGSPRRQSADKNAILLHYYREAPMLEESTPTGRGSFATMRHGCWATVSLADERVTDVRYRFVPDTIDASNDCEEIFASCLE
jgi:hypothetical protein